VSSTRYIVAPVVFGRYAVSLSTQQLLAIASILLLTWANTRGLRTGKMIQNVFTVAKTAALIGLIVIGMTLGWNARAAAFTSSWWHPSANGWSAAVAQPGIAAAGGVALALLLGKAMVGPLFAQSAWNNVTFAGGEVRDPKRNLPRALLIGCGVVVTLFLLANLSYVVTLPLDTIQHEPQGRVATVAMEQALGTPGVLLMAGAIMISAFGCNNGLILAGARVSYAMARDGVFFERIGRLNTKQVPAAALLAQGAWASLLVLPRSAVRDPVSGAITFGNVYTQLLEYIVPADLVMYAAMVLAVHVLRRRAPLLERPYRTPALPLTTAIYVGLALALVIDLAWLAPATSGFGYLIVASGIPVYALWRYARRRAVNTTPGPLSIPSSQ
jgi:APA family basic amino acid/polyamine antiporter